ncbi:MAG TPA: 3-carboxy-cis,cis-muconate cycloisomerase [Casimicrobiaceae bacterium]|nr:3-carboxy-cis,cis-muconate cycloisomerase [Casimicrobiaceae bacterium]
MTQPLFTTDALRAIFTPSARLSRMLEFEAALAQAEASVGVIPKRAADVIERHCDVSRFHVDAIENAAQRAGNLAIPMVAALTRNVAQDDGEAKGFVHYGATSQDAIDTGLVLQLRDALVVIDADLTRLSTALARLSREHSTTPIAGRTWLMQGAPTTFGVKLAAVVSALDRDRDRIASARERALVLQFGGAVGTLASLGDKGLAVAEALGARLGLRFPDMPWHTERDRICEIATALGVMTATLGKLARDFALLSQSEVGEAAEPSAPGRGGSSTMPQKRNPVGASIALAASIRVPGLVATMLQAAVQEHERGLGNWPAEWETMPQIAMLVGGALRAMAEVAEGLDIDAARMAANLDITQGLIFAEAVQMALAPTLGRDAAHTLVASACRRAVERRVHLRDILEHEATIAPVLDRKALDRLFDPANYIGESRAFIERALARHR